MLVVVRPLQRLSHEHLSGSRSCYLLELEFNINFVIEDVVIELVLLRRQV